MKKRIALFLLGVTLCLSGCGKTSQADLQAKGLELIRLMDEKAENEEYISVMSGSEQLNETAAQIGEGEYDTPKQVYRIKIAADDYLKQSGIEVSGMSEELQKDVKDKLTMALGTLLNSQEGALQLAVTNVIAVSSAFQQKDFTETVIYLYQFGDRGNSALAAFMPAEDGTVCAAATFLTNGDINNMETPEEIKQWISLRSGMAVTEIEALNKSE